MGEAPLAAAVEAFLTRQASIRRLSPHTAAAYRRDLAALLRHCEAAGFSHWRELHTEALRSFVAAEHRRGLSARSLQRLLSSWRSLLRWLLAEGMISSNPAQGLRAPKAPRKLPQVLDADEMTRLVEVPADDALGRRDRAMLELFYSSGLRLSELCGLRWHDIDLADGLVRVLGKGAKTRMVPIGSHARAALAALREDTPGADAPVFQGRAGRPISPRSVQSRIKVLAQQQGIWKRVHPHLLRHSCATHMLDHGADERLGAYVEERDDQPVIARRHQCSASGRCDRSRQLPYPARVSCSHSWRWICR